jgi:hypothetical protein
MFQNFINYKSLSEPKEIIHFIYKDDKDSKEIHRQASQYE